jgi:hypothetical protein
MAYSVVFLAFQFPVTLSREDREAYLRSPYIPEWFAPSDVLDRQFETATEAEEAVRQAYQGPDDDGVGVEWMIGETTNTESE